MTPSRQLAGLIAKFDPAVTKLIREARRALRRLPTAVELVYGGGGTVIKSASAGQRPRR